MYKREATGERAWTADIGEAFDLSFGVLQEKDGEGNVSSEGIQWFKPLEAKFASEPGSEDEITAGEETTSEEETTTPGDDSTSGDQDSTGTVGE